MGGCHIWIDQRNVYYMVYWAYGAWTLEIGRAYLRQRLCFLYVGLFSRSQTVTCFTCSIVLADNIVLIATLATNCQASSAHNHGLSDDDAASEWWRYLCRRHGHGHGKTHEIVSLIQLKTQDHNGRVTRKQTGPTLIVLPTTLQSVRLETLERDLVQKDGNSEGWKLFIAGQSLVYIAD